MISLADILFGEKKNLNEKKIAKTSNHNESLNKTVGHVQRKDSDNLRNKSVEITNKMIQNVADKNSGESLSKSQEIKKSIQISNNKQNQSDNLPYKKHNVKTMKNPKEERLYNKLKNFNSLDEVLNEVHSNKEYVQLFKDNSAKKEIPVVEKPTKLQGCYKPTSTDEAKLFKKIDELNKMKESQEITMLGKKHGNKSEISARKNSQYIRDDDIWCSKCKGWHDKDLHKNLPKLGTGIAKSISTGYNLNTNRSNHEELNMKKANSAIKQSSTEILLKSNSFASLERSQTPKVINHNNSTNYTKPSNPNEVLHKIKQEIKLNNQNHTSLPKPILESKKCQLTNSDLAVRKKIIPPVNEGTKSKEKLETLKKFINNSNSNNQRATIPQIPQESNKNLHKVPQKPIQNTNPKPVHTQTRQFHSKSYSNYSPSNPISQQDFLFSRNDFEDDVDDFIDDREEERPEEYRKYLDRINNKLRRGGGSYYHYRQDYSDSDDVAEAKFEDIEEEEKYTEMIGQKEDEEEEMRELLEMERKKQKKFSKFN
jgi:hypothetical protein